MSGKTEFCFEDYVLTPSDMTLLKDGHPVKLEPQVFQLLAFLIENHERILTKEEINEAVWNGRIVSDAALASRLRSARAAIGDDGSSQRLIKTIPNVGLRFVGDVIVKHENRNETKQFVRHTGAFLTKHRGTIALGSLALLGPVLTWWYLAVHQPYSRLVSEFTVTRNAAISGYNMKRVVTTSVSECLQACLDATDFVCKSVDFSRVLQSCDMAVVHADEVGGLKTDYPGNPYDHYSRRNLPEERHSGD